MEAVKLISRQFLIFGILVVGVHRIIIINTIYPYDPYIRIMN